ncbi:MAG: gluconate:H+ symporter [Tannerella sp.]|jgi:Gnt-I system high-affinity gluconate transporter|nr:gluconate:H+ symporter [Tannerella sp.]
MSFIIVIFFIAALILLISYFKVDTFLSFVIVSIGVGLALGIPLDKMPDVINQGIGKMLGDLTLIIVFGAMLGKLIAESGAAKSVGALIVSAFGEKYIQWGLMIAGFIVGIPLFYGVGFVLLVPLIFSVVNQYKLPSVYVGLPMLAALSVAHGFLPPSPSPVALIGQFNADIGKVLIVGIVVSIPSIIIAGPVFAKTLKNIKAGPVTLFDQKDTSSQYGTPGKFNSLMSALLPVLLLILATAIPYMFPGSDQNPVLIFFKAPSVVMLISLIVATYSLGTCQGRTIKEVMNIYLEAMKDIAPILLIVGGAGIFKEAMETSGFSKELADSLKELPLHPLILGWLITAIIRVCVGSATVAAITAASCLGELVIEAGVDPTLMVLSLGAGSLFFSHVNDSGFWMFKEYFNLSLKDTFKSWTMMETIVSIVGLAGVLVLDIFM